MKTTKTLLASALIYSLAVPTAPAQLTNIGAAAAVKGRVTALAPAKKASVRVIASGKAVYYKDKVETDAQSRMQVLLLDETVFTVGPNTKLTLDEFVYDPFTETGKLTVTLSKGVISFVSGKVARKHPENMKIKLPVGTIGVRGTAGKIATDGKSALVGFTGPGPKNNAKAKPGAITLTGTKIDPATGKPKTVTISRPGFVSKIPGPGRDPTTPAQGTDAEWASLNPVPKAEGGKKDGPGGKSTAKKNSRQDLAEAEGDLEATGSTAQLVQGFTETTNTAAQDSGEGPVTWSQLAGLIGGSAFYDSVGQGYTCGGTCSGSGSLALHFNINFNTNEFGGPAGLGSHVAVEVGGPLAFAEALIPVISFGALGGQASLIFGQGLLSATNSEFDGTTLDFINGGLAAQADLTYSNISGETAVGTAIATCTSGSCP